MLVTWLPIEGYNVFTFDYRGYGQSEGTPDRKGIFQDSTAAIKYIKSRKDIDTEDRVISISHSHMLYEMASEPKDILILKNGRHLQAFSKFLPKTKPIVLKFLESSLSK